MAKKKPKPMTAREKQYRKEARERLRERGLIPPVKKPLNRKQFAKETLSEYREEMQSFGDMHYLHESISWMVAGADTGKFPVTPEQVGVLKLMKIAVEIKRFYTDLKSKGISEYNPSEMFETVVKPYLKL